MSGRSGPVYPYTSPDRAAVTHNYLTKQSVAAMVPALASWQQIIIHDLLADFVS
jgi:hypothetical protein